MDSDLEQQPEIFDPPIGVAESATAPADSIAMTAFPRAPGRLLLTGWRNLRHWLQANSFAPSWAPEHWRTINAGYLFAGMITIASTLASLALVSIFPTFAFPDALMYLTIALVALNWGASASIVSAILGAMLLDLIVLPPHFVWLFDNPQAFIEIVLFLGVALTISLMASQTEKARRTVESLATTLTVERGRLDAIIEAVPDAIAIYDAHGDIVRRNHASQERAPGEYADDALAQAARAYGLYTASGELFPADELPPARALRGEIVAGVPMFRHDAAGKIYSLSISAAPFHDTSGHIDGAVAISHDVTALRDSQREVVARANQLEAIFEAITDILIVYGANGAILQMNAAAHHLFAQTVPPEYAEESAEQRVTYATMQRMDGRPLAAEDYPAQRLLRGETFAGADAFDITMQTFAGDMIYLNMAGAPVRDHDGTPAGGVLIARNVTERQRLDRRSHEALGALLAMAEVLVQQDSDIPAMSQPGQHPLHIIAQRLAQLAGQVLDCSRVGITIIDATEAIHPLVALGLTAAEEESWQATRQPGAAIDTVVPSDYLAQLRQGEVVVVDMTKPPLDATPNPFHIATFLIAPMRIGDRLAGMLTLDNGSVPHDFSTSEINLASAVAKLAALAIERERLLQEREEARANVLALREANQLMDEFLGIASHEIRTPLTTIKANIQLAERQINRLTEPWRAGADSLPVRVEKLHGMMQRTDRQIGRLTRLVNDLLDVARVHADKLELHHVASDLAFIVQEVVQEQRQINDNRIIHVEMVPYEGVMVQGDADRLGQVVANYLTNALKYSSAEQPVEVQLVLKGPDAYVAVTDHGPGIPPAAQAHIWERFHRVAGIEVQSGSGVGLGLGLYISQTIIAGHQGQVGVISTPGEGSTFWFTVPLLVSATE